MHQLTRPTAGRGRQARGALALLLLLAACAPPPQPGYRRADTRIYSQVSFDPARAAGTWYEVAGLYDPAASGCATGLSAITVAKGQPMRVTLSGCAGYGPVTVTADSAGAPARFRPELRGRLGEPWWVLWVDEDYRVMAIGTPSGHFGAIVSRTPTIRRDLLDAARQVLDFNGYDVSKLRPVMQ